ncbi:tetratricopeptide repeat protein [Desulfohalovibrio reitneri]|uniref:tetratricopeptide repeat protein n=1 Tax=Desulfohalovibrio reitneri TaxID=1307759 RepID=UPI0004A73312|nr:tetratricopeptide repeat protein [Desulfohalovibrio reitneri]
MTRLGRGLAPTAAVGAALLLALLLASACSPRDEAKNPVLTQADDAYAQGLYLEAENLYQRYIQEYPEGKRRWHAWKRILEILNVVKNDQEKALLVLEAMLLEFGPQPERARTVLLKTGDLHLRRGDLDEALEAWQKAARLDVDGANPCDLYERISSAHFQAGRFDLAQDTLRDCVESQDAKSCHPQCNVDLAMTYTFQENWPKAKDILTDLLQDKSLPQREHDMAVYFLAETALQTGDPEKAGELLRSIQDSFPNPKAIETKLKELEENQAK